MADADGRLARQCSVWCRHGRVVPNVSNWRAGDVVLSRTSKLIDWVAIYQGAILPGKDAAKWNHVGVYDGTGFIWDANPHVHVQERSVGDYLLGKDEIAIVRVKEFAISSTELIGLLGDVAQTSYDMTSYAGLLSWRLMASALVYGNDLRQAVDNDAPAVICSTFLERVLRHATAGQVFPDTPIVVPADYAVSTRFTHVPVAWHRLAAVDLRETVGA